MDYRKTMLIAGAVAIGLSTLITACGDDSTSGPMFGNVTFSPSFQNIGSNRSTELTVRNAGTSDLQSVVLGNDIIAQTTMPDSLCSTMGVDIVPTSLPSLAAGEESAIDVTIDTQGVDPQDCPPAQYDADLFASVSGTILGGATVRFDWDGTTP